jgi:hypothetical protein
MNKLLNALLALIENRPQVARELLRSPELKINSLSDIVARINSAIVTANTKYNELVLKSILRESLSIEIPEITDANRQYVDAFVAGVTAVEEIIEERLNDE